MVINYNLQIYEKIVSETVNILIFEMFL